MKKSAALLACLFTLTASSSFAAGNNAMNQVRTAGEGVTLEIEGSAQLSVPNDSAVLYLRIVQRHRQADQARSAVNALTKKTLQQIKETLPQAHIQTLSVNASPIYADANGLRQRIDTWQVSQNLQIRTDSFEALAQLIAQLPEDVGIDGINFELKDQTRRHWDQQLTQMAISDATLKAGYAAQAMGSRAGEVKLQSLNFGDRNIYAHRVNNVQALGSSKAADTVVLEAGQSRLSLQVQAKLLVKPSKR